MSNLPIKTNNQNLTSIRFYWDDFVDASLEKGRSPETMKNVNDALNVLERHLGITTIEECNDPASLDTKLIAFKKSRGFSRTTFNSYLKNVNTYFIWLKSRRHINENFVSGISRAAEEQKEQPTLSYEQVQRILGQLSTRRQTRLERLRNIFFIDLLRFTGARPCELLNLLIKDIQEGPNGVILTIRGKKQKGKPRRYRLLSYVRDSYENYMSYRAQSGREETNLFISQSKKTGWTVKGMRGLFKRLSKELGFKVTAYAFRRFVATTLCTSGASPQAIMNHLGHQRFSTTRRYIENTSDLTATSTVIMSKYG